MTSNSTNSELRAVGTTVEDWFGHKQYTFTVSGRSRGAWWTFWRNCRT